MVLVVRMLVTTLVEVGSLIKIVHKERTTESLVGIESLETIDIVIAVVVLHKVTIVLGVQEEDVEANLG